MALYSGIYQITNNINQKCYIGQSKNITERFKQHKSESYRKFHHDKVLYKAFGKYGIDNFSFSIIEFCQIDKLDKREIYWIKYYDSYINGYNLTFGGKKFNIKNKNNYSNKRYKIIDVFDYSNNDYLDESMDELSESDVEEYLDGIETMFDCAEYGGYNNFETWAECNLI